MQLKSISPRQSLNKAFLKEKVTRGEIERFKSGLVEFLDNINDKETEEYFKGLVTKFLYDTYYSGKNQINTKGRIDLAIYEDKKPVVIIEAKRPGSADMVTTDDLNKKALHELMLYYLQERVDHSNIDIKYLIITDTYQWFIFEASIFNSLFYQDKVLMKDFTDWKTGRKESSDRDLFYNHIAKPFVAKLKEEIKFTWFDLKKVAEVAKNKDPKDDNQLIDLFKILSPVHLLKQPFANDSNSLDTKFYSELLHIIGLEEKKDKGKKVIQRKEKPDAGSLLENAINILDSEDRLYRLSKEGADYGAKKEERLFNIALELCITWINRILFLKLLEGQLSEYHGGDKSYRFLDFKTIPQYDELNKLFFQVLAQKTSDRKGSSVEKYAKVPYLNSSLFEPNELERETIHINSLDDSLQISLANGTVLKSENGKKRTGELPTLQYLLEFLDAYDFASEGKEEIQEENKSIINASVLGLIFEKINGYKDGSFFTPGFITMYMCHETIRRAVVQKFNEAKGWKIEEFDQLHNKIDDISEANAIINGLKICDPAVGSGHFLVSALNEIIAIKSELRILTDRDGKVLRDYAVEVINDELIVSINHETFFEYSPGNRESQRVQEALFHEKQTLIENCLFGVDINPNSVKICRLRLWIELLKSAYYTEESKFRELETLPNIDINIKQGNSLISRFPLDADLSKALKSVKYSIDDYRGFVNDYKNATDKEAKRGFEKLIDQIKSDFRTEITKNDPKVIRKNKLAGELYNLLNQAQVFEPTEKEKQATEKKKEKLGKEINKLGAEIEEIKNSAIYKDAFEWRFEFPEVLDKEGEFIGFDLIIGNPPYIRYRNFIHLYPNANKFFESNYESAKSNYDLYVPFIELGIRIVNSLGNVSFILPHKWMVSEFGKSLRGYLKKEQAVKSLLHFGHHPVFDDATTYTCILTLTRSINLNISFAQVVPKAISEALIFEEVDYQNLDESNWNLGNNDVTNLLLKLNQNKLRVKDVFARIFQGLATSSDKFFVMEGVDNKGIAECYSNASESVVQIETDLVKPFVKPEDTKKYQLIPDKYFVVFPYHLKNGIASPMSLEYIKNNFPLGYRYFKEHEGILRKRENRRFDNDNEWFLFSRKQGINGVEKMKIITPEITNSTNMTLDEGKFYHSVGCYSYILSNSNEIDYKYYLGVLNSSVMWFFLKNTGNVLRGGYFRFKTKYLEPFPLPNVSIDQKAQIIKIVDEILKTKKKSDSNTLQLENKIDRLVYQLYGLTEEEIKIVEGKK